MNTPPVSHTVLSPISGVPAEPMDSFPVTFLINAYAEKGLDVRRFFEGLEQITLYRCPETGYRFYNPPSVAGDGKFYADLGAFPWYYPAGRWVHEAGVACLRPGMRIFEIGCGQGNFLEPVANAGCVCAGLDINETAVAKARKRGLNVWTGTLHEYAEQCKEPYDVVFAFDLLEHIYEIQPFMNAALRLLRPGGKLVLSMPNNDAFSYHFDEVQILNRPPHHVGLWDYRALLALGRFFPLRLDALEFEPLKHYKPQWIDALLRNRLIKKQGKVWEELPDNAWNLCASPARELYPFLHGPSMVATFVRL